MATLETLRLAGWKSIREATIEFRRLNVLVGANGAGKSNLVSFFQLLSDMVGGRLQKSVIQSGGPDALLYRGVKGTKVIVAECKLLADAGHLEYGVNFEPVIPTNHLLLRDEYLKFPRKTVIDKRTDRHESKLHDQSHLPRPEKELLSEIVALFAGSAGYHFDDTTSTAAVRRPGYIDDNHRLRTDAGNLAAMLYLYQQTRPAVYRRIVSTIKQVAPFLDDFVLEPRRLNPREIQLDWRAVNSDYLLGPHQLSDGTLRFIALATLLLQPEADLPPLIVLDEPELGLHPAAIGILAGLLKQAAVHAQVLVATQSATLLNHFDAEDVIVVDSKDGVSSFRRLDPEPYREWIAEYGLSDLWERNVIGGGPYA
jgi:predicted ATPase